MSANSIAPVRIAALGDLHIRTIPPAHLKEELTALNAQVDLVLLAGDITESGRIPEVDVAAEVLSAITVPMYGVLGNHDRRGIRRTAMRRGFEAAGLRILDGEALVHELPDGRTVGLAGVSGTGGGFLLDVDEPVLGGRLRQAVALKARREALRLEKALRDLGQVAPDITIALMHFAPTIATLGEEPVLKYWMLGNSLLGRIIDSDEVDLVIHGHAHLGNEAGMTPGGTPVRNVALPVTGGILVMDVSPRQAVRAVETLPMETSLPRPEGTRVRISDLITSR